ncbi:MAG: glycosyltransferase family 4 protein [Desulfatibacillaceae bacterium]
MTMLMFSLDYPPLDGGISRLCSEIACGYRDRGVDIRVLTGHVANGRAQSPVPALPEIRCPARRPIAEGAALVHLLKDRHNGPVLCGCWYREGLLAALAGAGPRVILAHGSELLPVRNKWRRGMWEVMKRGVLESAGLVVANSRYTADLVRRTAPAATVVSIPLAVDHERFHPGDGVSAPGAHGGKRVVLSVSRIHEYKGHDTVFRALARLPGEKRECIVYKIAGTGADLELLQDRAREAGVEDNVEWLGFVPEEDLPGLYREADLFVLCTREVPGETGLEGFGLVFLEAQACATPVVGANTGGISDAVKHGVGGWLIEQDDHAALADILSRLARDRAHFEKAGKEARQRVENECTWVHYLERLSGAMKDAGIDVK